MIANATCGMLHASADWLYGPDITAGLSDVQPFNDRLTLAQPRAGAHRRQFISALSEYSETICP